MTTLSNYWAACEAEVAALTKAKPRTATEVVAILRQYDPMNLGNYSGEAFFSAANAGESLLELLLEAGWAIDWIEADYHWQTNPPGTTDVIRYCEGDVYTTESQPAP